MKVGHYTIHENPGCVLDCACAIDVRCDGETIAFEFPQLTKPNDSGPMVYASMDGAELKITLTDRDDEAWSFAWNESEGKWYLRERPNRRDKQ